MCETLPATAAAALALLAKAEHAHPLDDDAPFILSTMLEVFAATEAGDGDRVRRLMDYMLRESRDPAAVATALMGVLKGPKS
ncbi:hypothetical protein ABZX88_34305 [Kitasatospora aureofaciens]|uniref:hypothetical protein n=1 Tax=Kitasatospora aureofaciens TaxID=1894 RepID=UPI0033A98433